MKDWQQLRPPFLNQPMLWELVDSSHVTAGSMPLIFLKRNSKYSEGRASLIADVGIFKFSYQFQA